MNLQNIIPAYKAAYALTFLSVNGSLNKDAEATFRLELHKLFMQLNPYGLMTTSSPQEVLDILKERGLKDFFIRLTSRFHFNYNAEANGHERLYNEIYQSCNVHQPAITNTGLITSNNLLGDENESLQLNRSQALALFANNRWYVTVCLFSLLYEGNQ